MRPDPLNYLDEAAYYADCEAEDRCATEDEAMAEYARNVGVEDTDRAWILTSFDVWVQNPFYRGPTRPHPESYDYEDEEVLAAEALAEKYGVDF